MSKYVGSRGSSEDADWLSESPTGSWTQRSPAGGARGDEAYHRPLKLCYHVFAAFLVGWVSDPTSETSEKDGSGDPSYENAQLQSHRPQ